MLSVLAIRPESSSKNKMAVPISVIIPILNEEKNLERCLSSIKWASEIFVVDSGSVDRSEAIAKSFGATVIQFQYKGGWPKKKGWALETLAFANEWVFLLDADEVVAQDAETEIDLIVRGPSDIDGYWINRRFMFLGKWLKHSYYPNWNLRLFRHALGRFERLVQGETGSGDIEIHEHVIVRGKTGRLKTELEHFAFPTVASFVEKHNRYSNWEAMLAWEEMRGLSEVQPQDRRVNLRRRLKLISHRLPFRPLLRFLYVYLLQRGFLDGIEGYYFAKLHASYELMSVIKTYELNANRRLGN
jgi:glycosyltransferase involved in cell wall biosynthesis